MDDFPKPRRVAFPTFDIDPNVQVRPMTLVHKRFNLFEQDFGSTCSVCGEWCLNLRNHLSELAEVDPLHAASQVMDTLSFAEDGLWAGFIEVSWVYTPMQVSRLFQKCPVCEKHGILDLHAHCLDVGDEAHAVLDVMSA